MRRRGSQRGNFSTTNVRPPSVSVNSWNRTLLRRRDMERRIRRAAALKLLEDRRLYHPLRYYRPAVAWRREASKVVERHTGHRPVFGFNVPNLVGICVRRKIRREVIHALGHAGRGGRPPRRNYWSAIECH